MAEAPGHDEHDTTERPAAPPVRSRRKHSPAEEVRDATFPVVMRGYDRHAVDTWHEQVAELVERLEQATPRDAAVRRALDEVGQETASILQRAHESAEEITSRSRSQAEGRLQRAEREAEITVREADARAERLEVDTHQLWHERTRLLEEMRQLADVLLGVADDATERLDPPSKRETEADAGEITTLAADDVEAGGEDEDPIPVPDETPTRITPLPGRATRPGNGPASTDDEDEDTVESPGAFDESEQR